MTTALTYAETGATHRVLFEREPLPHGYSHLTAAIPLGRVDPRAAADAVLTFRMHRTAGVPVSTTTERATPGDRVTPLLRLGPVRVAAPCEVVWTVETDQAAGFGYGTLPGHPECGEEAFVVHRLVSGESVLTVTAFSRPAAWYTRAAGPLVPLGQKQYARHLGRTLRRLCETS
ncbi:DUF1990 family protein [Allostreptomyces psammosilenae]|uniref:Uncharacterized protein (UPF0548 family) n=1 Tax=Allostreptomyces psammosilenae TaxID=1892865 RepID=A0A852ZZY0_9ACTN|nr:DUF1990 domain-containing protein [Allostreptomyces psammosilenae]NYI03822.1 uncharacterized protein (UPF0548 family) [Allostreptomyces psammosilenae]